MKKSRSKKIKIASQMPELYHRMPDEKYDVMKSEVVEWLCSQPDIREFVWDHIKQSGLVEYDASTGKWKGVDFEDGVFHGDGSADGDRAGAQGESRQWQAGVF